MRVAVLHRKAESKTAKTLVGLVGKRGISAASLSVDAGVSLEDYLVPGVRFIVVLPPEGYASHWVSWMAGFCRRGGAPLIAIGSAEPGGPLFSGVSSFADSAGLAAFLEAEGESWKQAAENEAARDTLFRRGIPYTEESCAACVRKKDAEALRIFLSGGLSPNTRDSSGVPLLCLAARAGDIVVAGLLLEAGAEVNALAGDRGGSALIDCALGKHRDIAALLVKAGADINLKSKDGQSALIISVGLSDEPFVELLLRAGANADEPDALGASARKYAALFHQPEIVKLFERYAGE